MTPPCPCRRPWPLGGFLSLPVNNPKPGAQGRRKLLETLLNVHCKLVTVNCILYTVYCTLCTVYCTLYNVNCIVYTVQSKQFECPTPGSKVVLGLTISTAHKSSTSPPVCPPVHQSVQSVLPPVYPVSPLLDQIANSGKCVKCEIPSHSVTCQPQFKEINSQHKKLKPPLAPIPAKHCALSQIAPAVPQYYQEFISLPCGIGTIPPTPHKGGR